jgi:hypothetical protein
VSGARGPLSRKLRSHCQHSTRRSVSFATNKQRQIGARLTRHIFVDIDALLDDEAVAEPEANRNHFTQHGHVAIAEYIDCAIRETSGLIENKHVEALTAE